MNVTTMNGIAVVTADGIRFLDKSYTCPLAIQERWFEKAHIGGFWFLPIYHLSNELSRIYFLHDDEIVTCYEILRGQPPYHKLERYFKSIQRLKRRRDRHSQSNVVNKEN